MDSKHASPEFRTEEDKIIEIIIMEGKNALYEDYDFIPNKQSLYEIESLVPSYDEAYMYTMVWKRPGDLTPNPEYLTESSEYPTVVQGRYLFTYLILLVT